MRFGRICQRGLALLSLAALTLSANAGALSSRPAAALGASAATAGPDNFAGLNLFFDNLDDLFQRIGGSFVLPAAGTVNYEGYVESGGLARRFRAIRPSVIQPGAPIVVMLHPRNLSPERMANYVGASTLTSRYGAWVLLPEALYGDWNDDPGSGINSVGSQNDVAFIVRMVDAVSAAYGLDTRRVYIAGYSNGGFMAERVACERSDRIAGLATVGASLREVLGNGCALSHRLPVVQFHGTGDLIVPYNGEPTLKSAVAASGFWARHATCGGGISTTSLPNPDPFDGSSVTLLRQTGCPSNAEVRLYRINGGGHTWPGSTYALYTAGYGRTSQEIDATVELWAVLSRYALPAP